MRRKRKINVKFTNLYLQTYTWKYEALKTQEATYMFKRAYTQIRSIRPRNMIAHDISSHAYARMNFRKEQREKKDAGFNVASLKHRALSGTTSKRRARELSLPFFSSFGNNAR